MQPQNRRGKSLKKMCFLEHFACERENTLLIGITLDDMLNFQFFSILFMCDYLNVFDVHVFWKGKRAESTQQNIAKAIPIVARGTVIVRMALRGLAWGKLVA